MYKRQGSAREQAASCQRVLGAGANIVTEYATKRYRSNLINWGMLPLQLVGATPFGLGDYVSVSYTHLDVYKRQIETHCQDRQARKPAHRSERQGTARSLCRV